MPSNKDKLRTDWLEGNSSNPKVRPDHFHPKIDLDRMRDVLNHSLTSEDASNLYSVCYACIIVENDFRQHCKE